MCTYQRKLEASSHMHRCRGKAIRFTNYGCVSVDLIIQNEKRLRRILLSVVISLYHIFFFKLSLKRHHLRQKVIINNMRVLIFRFFGKYKI
jgi:hypothetical protein